MLDKTEAFSFAPAVPLVLDEVVQKGGNLLKINIKINKV